MAKRFPLRRLLFPVGIFIVGIFTLLTTNMTATATSFTFTPDADSYVNASAPTTNYGADSSIWMDATPETNGYLRFNVQNLDGAVSSATLRVFVGSNNTTGFDVHQVADTSWIETGTGEIIYNNAPTIGSVINSSGAVTTNSWAEIDVTSYITGDGLYSFGVTTSSNNPIRFRTKESPNQPELVIETGSSATNTPTATATSTPTFTPTPTDGPTLTPTSTGTPTATNTPTPTSTLPSGGGSTFTFNPVADAPVLSNRATTNYGLLQTLIADSSPEINSYLRFDVQGLDGSPVTATLRLYALDTSSIGINVLNVADNTWQETSITYSNAPSLGSTINSSGSVTADSWVDIDISSYISSEGLVSLAFTTSDPNIRISFGSREATNAPELIVGTGGGATPTFTPTPTDTPTPVATPPLTPIPTRAWQQISTVNTPLADGEFAMAYDSTDDIVVLYGGNGSGWPYENSTWEFDDINWSEITTTQQPNAVYGMEMVYDSSRNVMVLFGGSDDTDMPLAETWEYDGTNWSLITPTTSPPGRTYHAMVYDSVNQRTILFGGSDGTTYYNDTWEYDGTTWTQLNPTTVPPARTLHAMALSTFHGHIVLFAGRDGAGNMLDDTWLLDLNTDDWFTPGSSFFPAGRMAHSMVYNSSTTQVFLIGGMNNNGDSILNDVWIFSPFFWSTTTETGPIPAYHKAIYDNNDDVIILFINGETWEYE